MTLTPGSLAQARDWAEVPYDWKPYDEEWARSEELLCLAKAVKILIDRVEALERQVSA